MRNPLNSSHSRGFWSLAWLLCMSVALNLGCATWVSDSKSTKSWPWEAEQSEPVVPTRVLAIWTDAIHHQTGQKAQRGFGGRIVFYPESDKSPIQVDGTLTIYAFPDDPGQESTVPEKKFVFGPEQLARHYGKCSLGDSYSVWLPWDDVGGPTRQITLITRFEPSLGGAIMSDPAKKLLPGVSRDLATDPTPSVDDSGLSDPRELTRPAVLSELAGDSGPRTPNGLAPNGLTPIDSGPRQPAPLKKKQTISELLNRPATNEDHSVPSPPDARHAIQQVGYLAPDPEPIRPTRGIPNRSGPSKSKVETINLNSLPASTSSSITVPNRLTRFQPSSTTTNSSAGQDREAYEWAESEPTNVDPTSGDMTGPNDRRGSLGASPRTIAGPISSNASNSMGIPQTLPAGAWSGSQDTPGSVAKNVVPWGQANEVQTMRQTTVVYGSPGETSSRGGLDAASYSSAESPSEWPRRRKTLLDNRTSLAAERNSQIQERLAR